MTLRLLDRAVWVCLLTLALAGGCGITLLLCHAAVPTWILPAAGIIALLVPRQFETPPGEPASRGFLTAAVLVIVLIAAVLAYGALSTDSRHWDGVVAWDAKAARLATLLTLEQPWFRDPNIYCHSRDYPLLQPLLMALLERVCGCGRALFPAAFLLATAVIGLSLRRRAAALPALLVTIAFAVTPNLVNPTSGAFDSGYADGMLAMTLTVAFAGIVIGDRAWLLLGCLLMVLTKPEGLFYGGALVAAIWVSGTSRLLLAATAGWLVGCVLQLSLQHDLQTSGASAAWLPTLVMAAAIAALLLVSDRWIGADPKALRRRRWVAVLAVPTMLIAGPLLLLSLTDNPGTFATYLSDPGRALSRLGSVPAIMIGGVNHAIGRGAFGLTWLLPPLLWWLARRRPACATTNLLGVALLLFAAIWMLPFLLFPSEDLTHHLRSTMPRLLNHGTGPAWLLIALLWHRLSLTGEHDSGSGSRPAAS